MREKFTIVVADDDLDDQDLIKSGLKDCRVQVQVVPVFDGLKLMDYLLRRQEYRNVTSLPDLILLDLNMPLMDGFQFLDEFEKLSSLAKKKCSIVMLTSSINPQDFNRSKKYTNVKLYLNKPLSHESIMKLDV